MPLLSKIFCCFGIHFILQQKQLLIKMINGWGSRILVFFFAEVKCRRDFGIINFPVFKTTVRKSPGNTDGTNCI